MTVPRDLAAVLGAMPLFPLQQVVLFPGMLLPLHVFEPRYVAMLREVMASHHSLAPVLVADPSADMSGEPSFASLACVGTVIEHVELPGKRLHIVLRGRGRVRLEELPFSPPYRRACASWMHPEGRSATDADLAALHHAAAGFAHLIKKRDPGFSFRLPKDACPAEIADSLSHQLVIDARSRQAILEALDERQRVRLVTETLTVQLATLSDFHPDDSN